MAHKHNTATGIEFGKYTPYISKLFIEEFDKRFCTSYETVGNRWRDDCEYSAQAEEFLILQSRIYLRNLDPRDTKSTNPDFLCALTNLMADYLSAYTKRSGITRKSAKEALKFKLYTGNPYIQKMLAEQSRKREERKNRTSDAVVAHRRHEAAVAAKRARQLHGQVMGEFADVRGYRKSR